MRYLSPEAFSIRRYFRALDHLLPAQPRGSAHPDADMISVRRNDLDLARIPELELDRLHFESAPVRALRRRFSRKHALDVVAKCFEWGKQQRFGRSRLDQVRRACRCLPRVA